MSVNRIINGGERFTEWSLVKAAKPLWPGHQQPLIPLNKHYYDLTHNGEMERQFKTAKEHEIDGFNVYFYWSLSKRLLETHFKIYCEINHWNFHIV